MLGKRALFPKAILLNISFFFFLKTRTILFGWDKSKGSTTKAIGVVDLIHQVWGMAWTSPALKRSCFSLSELKLKKHKAFSFKVEVTVVKEFNADVSHHLRYFFFSFHLVSSAVPRYFVSLERRTTIWSSRSVGNHSQNERS